MELCVPLQTTSVMDDTRKAMARFAAGILLSIVTRVWCVSATSPDTPFVLNGGLMLGLLLCCSERFTDTGHRVRSDPQKRRPDPPEAIPTIDPEPMAARSATSGTLGTVVRRKYTRYAASSAYAFEASSSPHSVSTKTASSATTSPCSGHPSTGCDHRFAPGPTGPTPTPSPNSYAVTWSSDAA